MVVAAQPPDLGAEPVVDVRSLGQQGGRIRWPACCQGKSAAVMGDRTAEADRGAGDDGQIGERGQPVVQVLRGGGYARLVITLSVWPACCFSE